MLLNGTDEESQKVEGLDDKPASMLDANSNASLSDV